jgi:hypothetical protein
MDLVSMNPFRDDSFLCNTTDGAQDYESFDAITTPTKREKNRKKSTSVANTDHKPVRPKRSARTDDSTPPENPKRYRREYSSPSLLSGECSTPFHSDSSEASEIVSAKVCSGADFEEFVEFPAETPQPSSVRA